MTALEDQSQFSPQAQIIWPLLELNLPHLSVTVDTIPLFSPRPLPWAPGHFTILAIAEAKSGDAFSSGDKREPEAWIDHKSQIFEEIILF